MGLTNTRIIQYSQIAQHFNKCQLIQIQECPIYGQVNYVQFNQNRFYLAQSHNQTDPPLNSLHYLVKPDLLIVPEFILYQNYNPTSVQILLQNLSQICDICGIGVGLGSKRIAISSKKWGIVGQKDQNWIYEQASYNNKFHSYVSPKMMLSLSQNRKYPKHNLEKSDIFILGIMTMQLLFKQSFAYVFNFSEFQIKLKPILMKLNQINKFYGQKVYQLFLGMVQIQQEYRLSFKEVQKSISYILKKQIYNKFPKTSHNSYYQSQQSQKHQKKTNVPSFLKNKFENNVLKKRSISRNIIQIRDKIKSQRQKTHSTTKIASDRQEKYQRQNKSNSFYIPSKKNSEKRNNSVLIIQNKEEKQNNLSRQINNDFSPFRLTISKRQSENQPNSNKKNQSIQEFNIQEKKQSIKYTNKIDKNKQFFKDQIKLKYKEESSIKINLALQSPKQVKCKQLLDEYSPIQLR